MAAPKKASPTKDEDEPKPAQRKKAKLESSNSEPRLGQEFSVSWDAPEPVTLWQEGAGGTHRWAVGQKGERQVSPMAAGPYRLSLRNGKGEELVSLAVTVKT